MGGLKYLFEWLKLTRFEHALLSSFGVLIGLLLAPSSIPLHTLFFVFAVPILINLGAFILNDYYDIATDIANKRFDRPLVKQTIKKNHAFAVAILLLLLGIVCSFFINIFAAAIAILFAILSFLYNYKLKELPLVGNIVIALCMAIAFPFGYVSSTNSLDFPASVSLLFFGAFFVGLAREIIKSIQDMHGDSLTRNSKTLPILIGKEKSAFYASLLFLLFCFYILLFLFLVDDLEWNYFSISLILISLFAFFALAYKSYKLDGLEEIRKVSLFNLFIIMLAIFLAGWSKWM
ncbi:MAG: UbiA family prenyltransferase [Candidatus Micrarchaeota archaeon]|nr:UbiA family prenyltransferase [Candidatus Micrarchaeota archaeon]